MKTIRYLFFGLLFLAIPFLVEAQSPDVFGYQQVIRDTAGYLIRSQPVSVQVSILQGTVNGPVVYSETQTPMTNGNALATLNVGQGTTVSGAFADIDWHNGPFFIKTETDPTGGNNRYLEHIEQILSVPYVFYANTAEEVLGPADPFYIGQDTMGGIVYYLYKDSSGTQRGFIIEAHDTGGIEYGPSIPQISSVWDGAFNKQHIPFGQLYYYLQTRSPDWYLPSADELILLKNNFWVVQKAMEQNGFDPLSGRYISSTPENHPNMLSLYSFQFISGIQVFNQNNFKIRLIKAF